MENDKQQPQAQLRGQRTLTVSTLYRQWGEARYPRFCADFCGVAQCVFQSDTHADRFARRVPELRRFAAKSSPTVEMTMLYNVYCEVVLPEEAERYWKIAPAAEVTNVVAFASA